MYKITLYTDSQSLYENGRKLGDVREHAPMLETRRHAAEVCKDLGVVMRLTGRIFAVNLGVETHYFELI